MKNRLFHFLDRTIGVITRSIYRITVLPFLFSTHPRLDQALERKAVEASADFALKNLSEAMLFKDRFGLWDYCLKRKIHHGPTAAHGSNPIILEFGVFRGVSINYLAKRAPNCKVIGFDSFEGLKENWYGTKREAGYFNTSGKLPSVLENVELVGGWFSDTLPLWNKENSDLIQDIRVIHIDCDTYESTKYLLEVMIPICRDETVFIFDEYLGYPGWEQGEHKAAIEIATELNLRIRYIGFGGQSVAVMFAKQ